MNSSRSWVRLLAGVVLTGLALGAAGCGGSPAKASGSKSGGADRVVARVGNLEVIDPFLPAPASPAVAAVYATLRNVGSTPDELVGVSTPVAPSSMLMTENDQGSTGTMTTLRELVVPPHGQVALSPGHVHAMLQQPTTTLKVGQIVSVTLRFARAGSVTVRVPVVPLDAILGGSGGNAGGMANMPGM